MACGETLLIDAQGRRRARPTPISVGSRPAPPPAEPAARNAFTGGNARIRSSFLTTFARARFGLEYEANRFQFAESNVLEAYPIFVSAKDRRPTHMDTLGCVQALVDLYAAWDTTDPDKGYDAKVAEWKAKLDAATLLAARPRSM